MDNQFDEILLQLKEITKSYQDVILLYKSLLDEKNQIITLMQERIKYLQE